MNQLSTTTIFFNTHTLSEVVELARDFCVKRHNDLGDNQSLVFQKPLVGILASSFIAYHLFKHYPQSKELITEGRLLVMVPIDGQDDYFFDHQELGKIEKHIREFEGVASFVQQTENHCRALGVLQDFYAEIPKNELDLFMVGGDPHVYRWVVRDRAVDLSTNLFPAFFSWVEKNMMLENLAPKGDEPVRLFRKM